MKTSNVFVIAVLLPSLAYGLTSDLFMSSAETAALLESEESLLEFLYNWLQHKAASTGRPEYARLARSVSRDRGCVPVGQDAGHPVDALLGLTRFTDYWANYIANVDTVVAHSVEKSLAESRLAYPDHDALHNARLAIVRLQDAYNLTADALLSSAASQLTAQDASSLARVANHSGFTAVAQSWLDVAVSLPGSKTADTRTEGTSHSHDSQPSYDKTSRDRHARFYSLCREFQFPDTSLIRSVGCKYSFHTVRVERWKTEILSTDPYVAIIYDCVTDNEAATIVNKATTKLTRALTGSTPEDFSLRISRRLGKIAWLNDSGSVVLTRVSRRIERITGLKTAYRASASFGEAFQVLNYGIGGHYIPHHDYFKVKDVYDAAENYLHDSGDRAATFMLYLGDVSRGGATVFTDLGIGAPPVKNAALFWYNYTPDGHKDPRTLHGGCPVIIGQKWIANKWIHEISTAMTKTCDFAPRPVARAVHPPR